MNLSPGANAFFSLDGGAVAIAAFAAGTLNGDGSQAGHWRGGSGIMDAVLDVNTAYQTAADDLRTRRDRLRSPRRPRTTTLVLLIFAAAGRNLGLGTGQP